MKSLSKTRGTRTGMALALIAAVSGCLYAQTGAEVSAKPGQRTPQPLPSPDTDGIHLTLNQAIGLALANNQDLNVSVNLAESSRFFLFQNMGIFDPLVQASATRAHSETPAASELVGTSTDTFDAGAQVSQLTPWGGVFALGFNGNRTASNNPFQFVNPSYFANLTASVTQPLLRNFGRVPTTWLIDIARDSRDATYQTFVQSVHATVNAVEQAYWDLVYAYEFLKVKQESKKLSIELNRITKIKIDVGSLAPIDIVQTEVDIATAEQDIITAEGLIGTAQDLLKRQLNVSAANWGNTPIIPIDPVRVEQQSFDLDQGVKSALQRRPEIITQNYTVAANRTRYEYWKNQTLPQLSLVGSYGRNGLDGVIHDPDTGQVISRGGFGGAASQVFNDNFKDWKVGLVFSYPILNRTAQGARGVAQYNLETSKSRLTVLELDVTVGVRSAHRAIDISRRQITAAAKARELAERNLDAARKKYDNGMTTSFEVSKITNDLSDARTRELNALVVYRKAVAAYHQAIADILDWKGIRIEGLPEMAPPPVEERADLVRRALEDGPAAP